MSENSSAKFALNNSTDDPLVLLGDMQLEIIDIQENGAIVAECDHGILATALFDDFPNNLRIQVHSPDGFGTFLFHEAEIYRDDSGKLIAEHICHQPNKYWEGTWGLATLLGAMNKQLPIYPSITLGDIELEDDWKRLSLRLPLSNGSAAVALHSNANILNRLKREAEIALGGLRWKPEYEKDERVFCEELLAPLLRRMQFLSVHYTQGVREYGKDFTFSEMTQFGVLRHFGLQAKAGDVSGEVNSAIDELVGQADDAFKMPYIDIASSEPRYISTFIVAISGRYTSNAKEKIAHKIPRGIHGSILFLDKESILGYVDRFWKVH